MTINVIITQFPINNEEHLFLLLESAKKDILNYQICQSLILSQLE